MKKYIKINITSPFGSIFKDKANIVNLRNSSGEIGITYGHTQLLSTLPAGVVYIIKNEIINIIYISEGILEVTPNSIIIITDDMERAENINKAEVLKEKIQAEKIIKNINMNKNDIENANKKIIEANARLKALNSFNKKNFYS